MKAPQVKKILLGALLVVMVYIWWDAFQVIAPSTSAYQVVPLSASREVRVRDHQPLEYLPPLVNPFKQFRDTAQGQASPQPARQRRQPQQTPKLSDQYQLTGILQRGKASQAVLVAPNGSSAVLSLKDSLQTWELAKITDNIALFQHEHEKDTLRLYEATQ